MFNISNFLIRDVSVIKAVSDFDKSTCITPPFFLGPNMMMMPMKRM